MLEAGAALSAFFVGLLGATHCVAMCGGIVGALTLGLPAEARAHPQRLWPYLFAYNGGRIASYTVAGVLAGALGAQLASIFTPDHARTYGHALSAVFLIVLGLYLAGWWRGLVVLERAGAHLWRRIEPLGRHLLPVRNPLHAAALGLLWGWLPCGLVYSALAWAFAGADPIHGGMVMLAFGLGTSPMLLTMGAAAKWLAAATRNAWLRQVVGVVIILFGVYSLAMPTHSGHGATTDPPSHQHSM